MISSHGHPPHFTWFLGESPDHLGQAYYVLLHRDPPREKRGTTIKKGALNEGSSTQHLPQQVSEGATADGESRATFKRCRSPTVKDGRIRLWLQQLAGDSGFYNMTDCQSAC